jgi:hypothetical protein
VLDDLSFVIRRLRGRNGIRREQRVRENTTASRGVADALTFGFCGTRRSQHVDRAYFFEVFSASRLYCRTYVR